MTRLDPRMCILGYWWQLTILRDSNLQKTLKKEACLGIFQPHYSKTIKSQYLLRQTSDRHQIFTGQPNSIVDFVGGPEWQNSNSRWRTAAILKKYLKCYNSSTSGAIWTKLVWSHAIISQTWPPWCGCHGNGRCLATAHWTLKQLWASGSRTRDPILMKFGIEQ